MDESQYINLIKQIIEKGNIKTDRTSVGTKSIFGTCSRYSLRDNTIPLLTTKRIFVGVIEELLWFISGSTNAKELNNKGVKIWNDNSSREFLDKHNFHEREEGDLGPIYGFQWRHFGAEYKDMHADYSNQGLDQLNEVIWKIKNTPNDRRIIMTAWNPLDISKIALPPCHCFVQFYVNEKELSCTLYQRSGDMGLGVPFNIASYSILTHMIAHITDLVATEFIHMIGDCHIYLNHIDSLLLQTQREIREPPKIKFNKKINNIDSFTYEDFQIINYNPHPSISMTMSI